MWIAQQWKEAWLTSHRACRSTASPSSCIVASALLLLGGGLFGRLLMPGDVPHSGGAEERLIPKGSDARLLSPDLASLAPSPCRACLLSDFET